MQKNGSPMKENKREKGNGKKKRVSCFYVLSLVFYYKIQGQSLDMKFFFCIFASPAFLLYLSTFVFSKSLKITFFSHLVLVIVLQQIFF